VYARCLARSGLLVANTGRDEIPEMGMRRARHRGVGRSGVVATLAALAAVGCSGSPRDQAKKALESLHSWAVSAQMVGDRWMHGAVPDPYARKALEAFGKKVRKERNKATSGKLPADIEGYLAAQYDSTAAATDSLLSLVGRGERRAAAILVARLSAEGRAADSVKGRLGAR
jgi:hypothetical protein